MSFAVLNGTQAYRFGVFRIVWASVDVKVCVGGRVYVRACMSALCVCADDGDGVCEWEHERENGDTENKSRSIGQADRSSTSKAPYVVIDPFNIVASRKTMRICDRVGNKGQKWVSCSIVSKTTYRCIFRLFLRCTDSRLPSLFWLFNLYFCPSFLETMYVAGCTWLMSQAMVNLGTTSRRL